MSFFGNNNNNNTTGGFGGFGSSANNNNNNTGGFGATSSSGSLFGNNTATSGGFGGGGFGSTNTGSPFGANKTPAFGAPATTTAGGMFGGNTATTGGFGSGGGFGATNNTTSGFGSTNTGGGLFGASKPAATGFGATNTGGSIFGNNNATGGFGSTGNTTTSLFGANNNNNNNATGGFGANANTANTNNAFGGFGASTTANNNNGSAGTPFQAFTEKDTAANQTSHYQSITFQQPYLNKSFEELRAEDYMQGRKFGNSNGQAGSFGTSTGFGGSVFGGNNATNNANAGGMFGGNNNNATTASNSTFGGFGTANNNQQTTSAFGGNNTSGGLFGSQNKPATGNVFGNTAAPGTATNTFGGATSTGGGLFGGGFGANTNANAASTNTGGGLFGNNNANTQNKTGFGFGNTGNTSTFGTTATNTGGGLFGNTTNTTNTGGGLFGNTAPQQQNNAFGTTNNNNTGGLFGNQNKPAAGGLFGTSTNTNTNANIGGGLFGNNAANNQQAGGLFGSTNTNTGGGLFGNNQQNKPATGGLFGNTNTTNTTAGGLFGNNNAQQSGGGLFGNNNNNNTANAGGSLFSNTQNKPATGGLFGGSTTNAPNTGGLSLFGNSSNQQPQQNTGSSLFGNSINNQAQQPNAAGSLFGNTMLQSNNQPPQQNFLHASLNTAAYGNEQLFASLHAASPPVGPLATPLNGARPPPTKTLSLMASTRISSPVYTPRNGSIGRSGYGFSYSTYGTPNSAYSVNLTPGASSLLKPTGSIGSGLASRLLKSHSMNNLRMDGTPNGDSLLRPTPGSIASRYVNSGSIRRLNIDRSLRSDLFAPPENKHVESLKDGDRGLKKSVSFENTANTTTAEPSAANALVRTEEDSQDESSPGLVKAGPRSYPDLSGARETEQANGANLSTSSQGREAGQQTSTSNNRLSTSSLSDAEPGEYWTKPAIKDLKQMSRAQLSKMGGLTVGRENVGRIEFGPCDLTSVPLDNICGDIVKLVTRIATVYEDENDKPAMGKGLNVPSTIYLERSWPRSGGGKKPIAAQQGKEYDKHIARLKRVHDTQFKSYDPDTGIWCFTVEHFTTYGLEEDDDMTEDLPQESSMLSDPPSTPGLRDGDTMQSMDMSTGHPEDDTFEFKLNKRSDSSAQGNVQVPGSIEGISYDYDDPSGDEYASEADDTRMSGGLGEDELEDPFTSSGGAVQAPSRGEIERSQYSMALGHDADDFENAEQMQIEPEPELPGSFNAEEPKLLRSILKPTPAVYSFMSPEKLAATSWEDHLQQTISPKKRDRQALRDIQQTAFQAPDDDLGESLFKRSMLGQSALGQSYLAQKSAKKVGFGASTMDVKKPDLGKSQAFRTSMDIMNSLWSQEKSSQKATATATTGFEKPYSKKPRLSAFSELDEKDAAFHDSFKPSFANNGTIVYAIAGAAKQLSGELTRTLQPLVGEHEEVRFAKWVPAADMNTQTLEAQQDVTRIQDGTFPQAITSDDWQFTNVAQTVPDENVREYAVWQLAAMLFDPIHIACGHLVVGMSEEQIQQFDARLRQDGLAELCIKYEFDVVEEQIRQARTAEEKALLYLTTNNIDAACEVLAQAKDYRLATLVAQLPGSDESRRIMAAQIEAWRERNDWSEMSDPIRAIYSILAGQVCVVSGKQGPAENRASEFSIAERFGLHWLRSFGLRVLFGGFPTIADAIEAFVEDLDSGRETVRPSPWWSRSAEASDDGREDTLMGLLRLYLSAGRNPGESLTTLFDPYTVSGYANHSRLAWQLATLFKAKEDHVLPATALDQLTLAYAAELESAGKLLLAAWVLLHLDQPDVRTRAIQGLLERNAARIPEPTHSSPAPSASAAMDEDTDPAALGIFESLVHTLHIPASLCWSAKALHAWAALRDASLQTLYLLSAGDAEAAHAVLRTTVGPAAVIEGRPADLDDLRDSVLAAFPTFPRPEAWEAGGAVFQSYATLVRLPHGREKGHREGEAGRKVLKELARGLRKMSADYGTMGLEQRVALLEMIKGFKTCLREMGEPVEMDFGIEEERAGEAKAVGMFERYRIAIGVGL